MSDHYNNTPDGRFPNGVAWMGDAFQKHTASRAKSVWDHLETWPTREEWAALNHKFGTDVAYPFGEIVPFPPKPIHRGT